MRLTPEVINGIISEMNEYERINLGAKFGPDFIELARLLASADKFDELAEAATLGGVLGALSLRRVDHANGPDLIRQLSRDSGMRERIAQAIYVGFVLGKREAETDELCRRDAVTARAEPSA